MANTYGIEVALKVIEKEIKDVFAVYGTHTCTHLQLKHKPQDPQNHSDFGVTLSVSRYRGGSQTSVAGSRLYVF